ncbi:MAG: GDSL-type esterase/lipase family protein [Planctomycetota bacterium]|nr:GDSL-type esterase/lipase family protein [Planctomycetota bacterium]
MRSETNLLVLLISVLLAGASRAGDAACFLRNGDVWVFHGDSITHADTYRRLCARVFRHYHPEANVEFIQAGVWGSASSDLAKRLKEQGRKPTVVTLMLGMNNAINGAWVKGLPRDPPLAAYRKDLAAFVQKCRAEGAAVILMSPTLADETCRRTFFRVDGANDFLRDCQRVVKEVAAAEGALYVPVQEEFEAFQGTLERHQKLRPDGVHPSSLGEYRIAQSLWERMSFAGRDGEGTRTLAEPATRLPVRLRPAARWLATDAKGIEFIIEPNTGGGEREKLRITWSLGDQRGTGEVALDGKTAWTLQPQPGLPALKPGEASEALIELRAGDRAALFVVDLCAVPVLHFRDNLISGTLESATDRPEGRRVAAWQLRRNGGELLLDADVTDSQIESSSEWAFARDGLNLFFDLRPAERFADINVDADVHQTMVNVHDQPFFAAVLRPWLGDGMDRAAACSGEKTATGYRVRLRVADRLNLHEPFALDKREFLGLALAVTDADGGGKEALRTVTYEAWPAQRPRDQYANSLMILDLKDKLTGEAVTNVHVFPPAMQR